MPEPLTRRERRRCEIVAVARKLIAGSGLEALTISALERRLEFSRGVITYHFDNKDDIIEAVLVSALDEIDDATVAQMKASLTLADKVQAMIGQTVRGFLEHGEAAAILISFWGRIPSDEGATQLNARLYRGYRRNAARLIEEALSGRPRPDRDVQAMAALFVSVVIGIVTQSYFEPDVIDVPSCIDAACRTLMTQLEA